MGVTALIARSVLGMQARFALSVKQNDPHSHSVYTIFMPGSPFVTAVSAPNRRCVPNGTDLSPTRFAEAR